MGWGIRDSTSEKGVGSVLSKLMELDHEANQASHVPFIENTPLQEVLAQSVNGSLVVMGSTGKPCAAGKTCKLYTANPNCTCKCEMSLDVCRPTFESNCRDDVMQDE